MSLLVETTTFHDVAIQEAADAHTVIQSSLVVIVDRKSPFVPFFTPQI